MSPALDMNQQHLDQLAPMRAVIATKDASTQMEEEEVKKELIQNGGLIFLLGPIIS